MKELPIKSFVNLPYPNYRETNQEPTNQTKSKETLLFGFPNKRGVNHNRAWS